MNNLSDVFHDLAERDERAFANAPRDTSAIAHARRARHRTRAVQATGGTFAIGALTVGGIQLIPDGEPGLNAAAAPSASTSTTAVATPAAEDASSDTPTSDAAAQAVTYDTRRFGTIGNDTLEVLDGQFQCGAPAPAPSSGRAELSIDSVDIRTEDFVRDFTPYLDGTETGPVPVVDDAGNTEYPVIAQTTVTGTGGDALYADLPSTVALLAKDGEIVAVMGAQRLDPTEQPRTIPAPEDMPEEEAQPQVADELGADPVLNDAPAAFTTGYGGWGCPDGFGDILGDTYEQVYPPLGDYVEAGEYELYVVGRVLVDDQSAAEHVLRDKGFDLWNHWTELEQAEKLGLDTVEGPADEEDGVSYLQIDVPVPGDYLPAEASDEIVVSEPVTVTVE